MALFLNNFLLFLLFYFCFWKIVGRQERFKGMQKSFSRKPVIWKPLIGSSHLDNSNFMHVLFQFPDEDVFQVQENESVSTSDTEEESQGSKVSYTPSSVLIICIGILNPFSHIFLAVNRHARSSNCRIC